ncbi:MAG: Na+/H+ antiporter NhaC family protein [Schleiferiaceae bacterium]
MTTSRKPNILIALLPVIFLILGLWFNVSYVFGDNAVSGSNQVVLLLAGAFAALLGNFYGTSFDTVMSSIKNNISDTTKPLLILLLIGALSGTWLISGVVPAMIYYGLQFLNPTFFLVASVLICAVVSVATGSSWSTTATVGIALIGIGKAMGLHEGMVAGAIISGAYFGDKMSPLSDTTNLAPAMAGADLFTHIRYMALTTIPSISIALIIFAILGFTTEANELNNEDIQVVLTAIESHFNINPFLFIVPAFVVFLIIRKVDALVALLGGVLLAAVFALIFQGDLIAQLGSYDSAILSSYEVVMQSMALDINIPTDNPTLESLLSSGGMVGMLGTVFLILSAMVFGGAMEATGFLGMITQGMARLAKGTASLVLTTAATCGIVNVTASDQYLALVVPGRMFKDLYRRRGLAPENLSRTLEDSGTVTSVLIPWNTCGAYQSGVLGVATGAYLPYAFFNLISPLMTLLFAFMGIKIAKLPENPEAENTATDNTSAETINE